MRRVFLILSSKLDRKLNHPRRARTILRSKVNIYGTIILRVYGEYTITSFLGNFGTCANISYQAAFPPPPSRHRYEANNCLASTPGRPLEEGRPGIDCLRMRGVFRILSSKFDSKLNYARRARTL